MTVEPAKVLWALTFQALPGRDRGCRVALRIERGASRRADRGPSRAARGARARSSVRLNTRLTGLISRRAGETTVLLAAAAFMIQRLAAHRSIWRAPEQGTRRGRALSVRPRDDDVRRQRRGPDERQGVRVAWNFPIAAKPKRPAALCTCGLNGERRWFVPSRAMAEGQSSQLVGWARGRIRPSKL